MSKKLEILKNSLVKKQAELSLKFDNHFDTVKQANGQPLNDKRNGQATLNKWEKQNDSIRSMQSSIEKTKQAIEKEECKIVNSNSVKEILPSAILRRIESGVLVQWAKHPETFFVKGVDKVRIVFDKKTRSVGYRYKNEVTDADQWRVFARTYNEIQNEINRTTIQLKKKAGN